MSAVTYTAESAAYVRAGFDRESGTASDAFCSASVERSHKEKHAQSLSRTRRYMTGLWRYPRATVFLDECTAVSPKFVAAVEQAVASGNARAKLEKVLARFGHAVPSEVLLGGQLMLKFAEEVDNTASEAQSEDEIAAAVSIKVASGSGSASVATGSASREQHAAERIAQQTSFEAVGGQTLLTSNPKDWVPMLADPNLWAAIGNREIDSTLSCCRPRCTSRRCVSGRSKTPCQRRQSWKATSTIMRRATAF